MTFEEILVQVLELLQREGRLSYPGLKLRFNLDDAYLEALKAELIDAKRLAADEDGKVLVWTGASPVSSSTPPLSSSTQLPDAPRSTLYVARAEGERRQLTVMFCDLVGSTTLSEQLDPEELRDVVSAYHATCAEAITRYGGHTAQHLGDGLLVYFGYPAAHEDDAQRAVRTGVEILAELPSLNARLPSLLKARLPHPVQVRIGVHTGLVVIGEIGSSEKREILALGETPNIAARVQGCAEPDAMVVSAATQRLVHGLFECQALGPQPLKGISTPLALYRVLRESAVQSRFEVAMGRGLTPLVGREAELGVLQRCWAQATDGAGQVVLLSGEPGIGKSRLVQEFKEQLGCEGVTRLEFRCSPYHQNSALSPIIDHLQRLLQFTREDSPATKLEKLHHTLSPSRFPQADTLPLLAALLSLPHPEGYPPMTLSPQKQKEKTQAALVAWLVEEATRSTVYTTWEDLHWTDPSTLEVLTLLLDQVPTTRLLAVLTFRPEFMPPWGNRSHLHQLTLNRLGHQQVEAMVEKVTGGKALPREVLQQIVHKTDGVPLFVEELTKTVLESNLFRETENHYELTGPLTPLAIPSTLQDSLMARLDRLSMVREIAQLGATIGREFSYELLQAVSRLDEATLQQGLKQLVTAELVYQRGLVPQAHYLFKHALIQDTAYQSLLKSKRQHYHQQIAHVLETQFPETTETQPELLAHHYTEAGLAEQAIPYWQKAGQKATQRSANTEAINHLTKGIGLLMTLPDTPERIQQELTLQLALAVPLTAVQGQSSPDVAELYARARTLCQQGRETPQLFMVLWGIFRFHFGKAEYGTARELAEQLLRLAQSLQDSGFLLQAHRTLGTTLCHLSQLTAARVHLEQAIALYDPERHRDHAFIYGGDPRITCRHYAAMALGYLGYPDQELKRVDEMVSLARESAHPHSLAFALSAAGAHGRGNAATVRALAEESLQLCTTHGLVLQRAMSTIGLGLIIGRQGQVEEGLSQTHQGLAAFRAGGIEAGRLTYLTDLASLYLQAGRTEEGFQTVAEALAGVQKRGDELCCETKLYQIKGELTLQQANQKSGKSQKATIPSPQPLIPRTQAEADAEACFLKAIEIARKQQAKVLELRAVMSLSRLWQQQGKKIEAWRMLAEIYGWFTEGFTTKDLQEAKALLEGVSRTLDYG